MPETLFEDCKLEEVDFTEANLESSIFKNCEMKNSTFDATNIQKADFTEAYGFMINPEKNNISNCKFSRDGALGLLTTYNIVIE